jgi:hypothetical protein
MLGSALGIAPNGRIYKARMVIGHDGTPPLPAALDAMPRCARR